jgi:hypothetical protein
LRTLGSIRAERTLGSGVTLGVGVLGSFASDRLNSFVDSGISDKSLQANVYVRARLDTNLRAGAFASIGKAWYDFDLQKEGFILDGRMTGNRHAFGAMLSGDFELGGIGFTTDVALSRAVEKLGNATLAARYKGENRSGIAFRVGTVDATRLSVPFNVRLFDERRAREEGKAFGLVLSPGLLCEDQSADASSLTCGYQVGGRFSWHYGIRDLMFLNARYEDVEGVSRKVLSFGYAHRFGPLELGLSLDRENAYSTAANRALLRLRVVGK